MMPMIYIRYLLFAAAIVTSGVMAPSAAAQSESQLQRENQRLAQQVRELTNELDIAKKRIEELEQQVAQLERALAAARNTQQPGKVREEVTIDESEPTASPRALLRALQFEYAETMKDMELGSSGDRERTIYMRTLQRWQAAMMRKYRSQVQWHVRLERETATRAGYDLRLAAVDPVTYTQLGPAIDVSLPRSLARRYELMRNRDGAEVLVLRGTLIPHITINPDRVEPGAFDNPPLIGPFAEFGLTVEPRSLLAVEDDEE